MEGINARMNADAIPGRWDRYEHPMPLPKWEDTRVASTQLLTRLGGWRQPSGHFAFWIQLRGNTEVEAREGHFRLSPGQWIAFDPGAGADLRLGRHGMALGLLLPDATASRTSSAIEHGLFPGLGVMSNGDLRLAMRLWRDCARQSTPHAVDSLLLHLQHLQQDLHQMIDRCPGRMARRRRQVLARMQRIRMMLEGNIHRSVRLDELAALGQFSDWWVSKTFHAVYGETIQRTSIRLRMQRARDLLRNTTYSIGEIGEMCGIQDPCSFARQFKVWHGRTASQWRREQQVSGQSFPSEKPVDSDGTRLTGT
jgi:AraC family transcriptional regulator